MTKPLTSWNWLLLAALVVTTVSPLHGEAPQAADPSTRGEGYVQISGIYPHLAVFNQPADPADRPNHGECGIGAIAVWADRLWYLTYPQHKTTGSNDKLYELDPALNVHIRPESVGGTHAARLIHRESQQLILGPYFIDRQGNVRAADLQKLRGRMTAIMRHLSDPAHKVYFFDMEGAIYEVDVYTLAVKQLFTKPVPGWHGKGGYTAQGRVVIANNGESGPASGYKNLLVGGPAQGEEAGVLAEWDGQTWRIIERKQFCDVTGPGGIEGSSGEEAPLWAVGWDKRSVILKLLDGGRWFTFRLPKASHTFDPRHGWYTEWPRIREIAPGRLMLCMHGQMFDFPPDFSAGQRGPIRPLCTHLRIIPDFCHWQGKVVLGADDASMMNNPLCGQAQSNLWFGTVEELSRFGPPGGWGGVFVDDAVTAERPSDPYLFAGYAERVVHVVHDAPQPVEFSFEIDERGTDRWRPGPSLVVPPGRYGYLIFDPAERGEWIRVKASVDCHATVYFHYLGKRPASSQEESLFAGLAEIDEDGGAVGGLIRPAAHNRSLQMVAQRISPRGDITSLGYYEVDITPQGRPVFQSPEEDRSREVLQVAALQADFEVDRASAIVRDGQGQRWRLPKGDPAFEPFVGRLRAVREVATERFLAHILGTFYEVPRDPQNRPDWSRMKAVASHRKRIVDFCSWRGLLVLAGVREGATEDGQVFTGPGGLGLWFGALDDLWKLGAPRGEGGPWCETLVQAGEVSDPYLMTGFARKTLTLSQTSEHDVTVTIDVDFDHQGFHPMGQIRVPTKQTVAYEFPPGYHAHWVRFRVDQPCRITAWLIYQ